MAALLCIGCLLASGLARAAGNEKLAAIHATIRQEYAPLEHVDASALAALADRGLVIFDVRGQSEFDVSHIPGAIRVAPDLSADKFMSLYRDIAGGKSLVFYCSVGQRSSALASRVRKEMLNAGAAGIYNLQGGIFRWHNDGRALVSGPRASAYIHPYNAYWGRLIDRSELIRYQAGD
jgi:rhodanese-related sulfurtransferase